MPLGIGMDALFRRHPQFRIPVGPVDIRTDLHTTRRQNKCHTVARLTLDTTIFEAITPWPESRPDVDEPVSLHRRDVVGLMHAIGPLKTRSCLDLVRP
jgi:hypothetical protein